MNYSLPGSSVHGIVHVRILEWVAIPFSRASSQPRDRIQVSCIAGRFFTIWDTREAPESNYTPIKKKKKNRFPTLLFQNEYLEPLLNVQPNKNTLNDIRRFWFAC